MSNIDYLKRNLTSILECLSTHPGDARKRLIGASLLFIKLQENDFPEECKPQWRMLMVKLKKRGPLTGPNGVISKGAIENTMRHCQNKTASEICKIFFEVYWKVLKINSET